MIIAVTEIGKAKQANGLMAPGFPKLWAITVMEWARRKGTLVFS